MWRVTLAVLAVAALTLVIVTWDTLKYRVLG
jgi:hypothetical protein